MSGEREETNQGLRTAFLKQLLSIAGIEIPIPLSHRVEPECLEQRSFHWEIHEFVLERIPVAPTLDAGELLSLPYTNIRGKGSPHTGQNRAYCLSS